MTFGILRTDGILWTGELPHHILHFADRDALGGAPNASDLLETFTEGGDENPEFSFFVTMSPVKALL